MYFYWLLCLSLSLGTGSGRECGSEVDIVFLLDTSDSVGPKTFHAVTKFVRGFISNFKIGPMYAQIGVDTFDDAIKTEFKLKTYANMSALKGAIGQIKYRGRGTETAKALRHLRLDSFNSKSGSRSYVTKVAVVMTDGRSYKGQDTEKEASNLKADKIKVFVIGIGKYIFQAEVEKISSEPTKQFAYDGSTDVKLKSLSKLLSSKICKMSQGPFFEGYIGCFSHKNSSKRHKMTSYRMVPNLCINHCKFRKMKYAHLKGNSVCFCSTSLDFTEKRSHTQCRMKCSGNNIKCGSMDAAAVYETGYLGCFTDSSKRVLSGSFINGKTMTAQLCTSYCKSLLYRYSGVQNADQCFCGDDYTNGIQKPESDCGMICSGNNKQTCGGGWRNNVFKTGTNYIGCFEDKSSHILTDASVSDERMTNEFCIEWCREQGFKYAGTKAGSSCFCGKKFDTTHEVQKRRAECSTKCKGNSCQKCGGTSRISVFKAGLDI